MSCYEHTVTSIPVGAICQQRPDAVQFPVSVQRIQQPQGKGNILTLSNYILNTQKQFVSAPSSEQIITTVQNAVRGVREECCIQSTLQEELFRQDAFLILGKDIKLQSWKDTGFEF